MLRKLQGRYVKKPNDMLKKQQHLARVRVPFGKNIPTCPRQGCLFSPPMETLLEDSRRVAPNPFLRKKIGTFFPFISSFCTYLSDYSNRYMIVQTRNGNASEFQLMTCIYLLACGPPVCC
jgi:hypothetical protein